MMPAYGLKDFCPVARGAPRQKRLCNVAEKVTVGEKPESGGVVAYRRDAVLLGAWAERARPEPQNPRLKSSGAFSDVVQSHKTDGRKLKVGAACADPIGKPLEPFGPCRDHLLGASGHIKHVKC